MDTKVEPPPDFLATKTAASVGRCCPTLMSRAIVNSFINFFTFNFSLFIVQRFCEKHKRIGRQFAEWGIIVRTQEFADKNRIRYWKRSVRICKMTRRGEPDFRLAATDAPSYTQTG